jgi:hypothetical protein
MKTLIIHPSDETTDFLCVIYEEYLDNLDYTIIRDYPSGAISNDILEKYDRIIMLGHGCPEGLLHTNDIGFLIDESNVETLRNKELIAIWCNADLFFLRHDLVGLYTGMIISEKMEALYCLPQYTIRKSEIKESNERFAAAVKKLIEKYGNDKVLEAIKIGFKSDVDKYYPAISHLTKFNNSRIFLNK